MSQSKNVRDVFGVKQNLKTMKAMKARVNKMDIHNRVLKVVSEQLGLDQEEIAIDNKLIP